MAYEIIRPNFQIPIQPASTIVPRTPVKLVGSNALRILPVGSSNDRPFGIIGEATAPAISPPGEAVQGFAAEVREDGNIVKAIAGASFAAGAEVTIATIGVATIAQGGSTVATVPQYGAVALASGTIQWIHGWALDSVAAGEIFTLYFKPRLTGNGGGF